MDPKREKAINDYIKAVKENNEARAEVMRLREEEKKIDKELTDSEDNIRALQTIGQCTAEVLKRLDDGRYVVDASSGTRYVVGARGALREVPEGARVTLDGSTHTIMRVLPREVSPRVFNMRTEGPGEETYASVGGLAAQIRELREAIELPITNPELFQRVGITPPKGVLLYGPPGTGKTLLARAVAAEIKCSFLKVVASAVVEQYIGDGARIIREMFAYARDHEPCIIFMDEIDAIGSKRLPEGQVNDREVQRTLMELLNQLDGFNELGKVKVIMATNRPDVLDAALLRPGRLDRKIEIPLPDEQARVDILKIHSKNLAVDGDIDFDSLARLSEGFNGADLRNVCTEAGLFAIRADRECVNSSDLAKAVRKIAESKKLESQLTYEEV